MEESWAKSEFLRVDFGDQRLNDRLFVIGQRMYCRPMKSINGASNSWGESKAAYRFFSNPKVTPEKILSAHSSRTLERIQNHSVVLLVQDTCFFNFTSHFELKGTGPIGTRNVGKKQSRGLITHSVLAIAAEGEGIPLGIVHQKTWARPDRKDAGAKRRKKLSKIPPQNKESFKWIEGITNSPICSDTNNFIHVADREADINIFLSAAQEAGISYLVRGNFDRALESGERLSEFAAKLKPCGTIEVPLAAISKTKNRDKRTFRVATLDVRFSKITLKPNGSQAIECWMITAKERAAPPKGQQPINWTLLTNIPVETHDAAIEKITWYRMRWHIENFHKVLKSGCRVEHCEVETAERMKNFMALMSVVAWRLYWISRIARVHRTADATEYFSPEELTVLEQCGSRKVSKKQKISLIQAIHWLAQLGGFKSRTSDGDPGMISIWSGWQVLQNSLQVLSRMARFQSTCG